MLSFQTSQRFRLSFYFSCLNVWCSFIFHFIAKNQIERTDTRQIIWDLFYLSAHVVILSLFCLLFFCSLLRNNVVVNVLSQTEWFGMRKRTTLKPIIYSFLPPKNGNVVFYFYEYASISICWFLRRAKRNARNIE